jgi:DNA-binding XRE family transcriptional regulator
LLREHSDPMPKQIGLASLTDSELIELYAHAKAEDRRLRDELSEAESAFGRETTPESLARVREVRTAAGRATPLSLIHTEIIKRLNAPLRTARKASRMTRGELGERAGVSRKTIQLIEEGKPVATYQDAIRLWSALGLDLPQGWDSLDLW